MGTRIQNLANNFTTAGIVKAAAINDASISAITAIPSGLGGALTLIKSVTASASATISFVDGTDGVVLDGTYLSYVFKFINIHPSTASKFTFNGSTDSGANYNVTKTSTYFNAYHNEAGTLAALGYDAGLDLAQSTSFQRMTSDVGGDNDQCMNGILNIFNPSSSVYVKHFLGHSAIAEGSNFMRDDYYAGYANTTSPLTNIKFEMTSGNIDDGTIQMYGIA